jgi:hypothetical protein
MNEKKKDSNLTIDNDHKANPTNPWKAKIEWHDQKNELVFMNDYRK